ncbi:MAG: exodeoxyribonuclease VII small subunit [Bacilli bacterium]
MEDKSFEELLKELQDVVTKLESGKLSLEESVEMYKKGMSLSLECKKRLDEAKKVVITKVDNQKEESF